MSASTSLLTRWQTALVFRIGENDTASFDQLPDFRNFPDDFPHGPNPEGESAGAALGYVIAAACLKLWRPWPMAADERCGVDLTGGWANSIEHALEGVSTDYGDDLRALVRITLGTVIDIALRAPGRLPALYSRLDRLDNAMLHSMAMAAIYGRDAGVDLFEGMEE